jgi:DNA polymerase I
MELDFQLLDCDYINLDNSPLVRIFGKDRTGKTVCAFVKDFFPYFYILPKEGKNEETISFLENKYKQILSKIEEIEKYLPTGYQKAKTKLLKIFLKDPSQTPIVRDELKRQEFVEDIFEADILFKYRFMVDKGLSGMGWVKIDGSSTQTSVVKTTKKISVKSIESIGEVINADLKHMAIDIEVVPGKEGVPDPAKDPIVIISLSFFPAHDGNNTLILISRPTKTKEKDVLFFQNETKMLEEFVKIFESFDPDIIVGYNINGFDLPYLLERLKITKNKRDLGRCTQKLTMSKKFGIRTRNSMTGRIVADVYELIKESVEKGQIRLKRYGLGDVSKELINEDKVDITHSEIAKHWNGNEEQMSKLIDYARKDAELVLKLLLSRRMLDKFVEISKISGVLLQDVLEGGEAIRVENLLLREFNKQDYVVPCKPDSRIVAQREEEREAKGFKGALVLEPMIGLHTTNVVYLDFRSMYPSIFIAYNICPTTILFEDMKESIKTPLGSKFVPKTIKEGIMPKIVRQLVEDRDKMKTKMRNAASEEERRILDAKQIALKYMTNSFYGYTGYVRAKFYVLDIASTITACGRELIQKTKNVVEEESQFKVIYGDTDSIMVKTQTTDVEEAFRLGGVLEKKINTAHEGKISVKIESVFKTLLILTKKRYAGLSVEKENGKLKEKITMKGIETVRRDWCDLVSKSLYTVLEIVLKEQDPKKALLYIKEILSKLEKNEIPIEDLVVTKSVSKSLREYKGIQPHVELLKKLKKRSPGNVPGIGDRIGFVIIKGLQLMSDRAEDPEYIKQNKLKIDSKYYIESQLLPPLERVFEAIGISKTELVGLGKQLLLMDAIRNGTKKPKEDHVLKTIDGFICDRCNKIFRRVPLIGRCDKCSGEIMFYLGDMKSRYANL